MPLSLERIDWRTKRYIFMGSALLSSLYLFQPTNSIINYIVEYELEAIPIINVRNILAIALFVIFIALKYNQVD